MQYVEIEAERVETVLAEPRTMLMIDNEIEMHTIFEIGGLSKLRDGNGW
ncbi:MAG: hypothetical protein IPO98_15210 [Saprospiraceae bacterium]|nr:hypothetical protein [Saprospiraceae bacterium]